MLRNFPFLHISILVCTILSITYFLYHFMHGERSFAVHSTLKMRHAQLQTHLEHVTHRNKELTHLISLLNSPLDLDLLEHQVRQVLGYIHPYEMILNTPLAKP